jgi:hypothetical protein
VRSDVLAGLPGVSQVETAKAIEAADRLRQQAELSGAGRGAGKGGNSARPQGQSQGAGGPAAPVPEGETDSTRFRLYTENTTLLVTSLVDFSRANSLSMNILNVRSPSLEDAFVRLTEEVGDGN